MFCVTGWEESEPSNPFSTLTDNWTWKWFGEYIFWNETRLIIFWGKITLSKVSCRKKTGMSMCLTLGVNILALTKEIQLVLTSQCTVGTPVLSDKASMYLWIDLYSLASL